MDAGNINHICISNVNHKVADLSKEVALRAVSKDDQAMQRQPCLIDVPFFFPSVSASVDIR
jgi:hypothetical protein